MALCFVLIAVVWLMQGWGCLICFTMVIVWILGLVILSCLVGFND